MAQASKRRWLGLAGLGSPLPLLIGGGLTVTGGWLVFRAVAPEAAGSLVERVTGTTTRQVVSKEARLAWDSEAPIRLLDESPVEAVIAGGEIFHADPAFSSGVSDEPPPPEEVQRELARSVAGFLAVRALADPAAYRSFMNARGYRLRDDEALSGVINWWHRRTFGERERPEEWGAWEAFEAAFAAHASEENADWLVAVSSVERAVKLRFATIIDERDPPEFDWTEIPIDSPYWGSSSMGARAFFEPGISRVEILRRDGKVLTSVLRVPVQARGGHWTVLAMSLYFEPRSARWFIEDVSIANAGNVDRPPVY